MFWNNNTNKHAKINRKSECATHGYNHDYACVQRTKRWETRTGIKFGWSVVSKFVSFYCFPDFQLAHTAHTNTPANKHWRHMKQAVEVAKQATTKRNQVSRKQLAWIAKSWCWGHKYEHRQRGEAAKSKAVVNCV